jgi:O-antigen ligase
MLMIKRLSVAWEHAGVGWSALYYDLVGGAHYGQASLRALELKLGWEAYLASPIFGQGPWGRFEGYSTFGESWHGGEGAFGFVHSGLLHVLFKSGLVGFALLCGLLGSFVWFVRRAYPALEPRGRAVLVMGAAGVLFMLPDICFGTPFIQVRTTQLLGLCLALPYIAHHLRKAA